jgi:hypothetical protein
MKCSVEGCGRPVLARGWCVLHYDRWRRHGDPLIRGRLPAPEAESPVVILQARGSSPGGKRLVLCRCPCGNEFVAELANVRSGHTRSCGCRRREAARARHQEHGQSRPGAMNAAEYVVWCRMKSRCLAPTDGAYPRYGGRGITVCDRWRNSFENFLADVGPRPSPRHTLERIDNDGPYSPENCCWATPKEQGRNKRTNHLLTFQGETRCLTDWAESTGLRVSTLYRRLKNGWSVERTLTTPLQSR